ncbi:MAG: hypothetical protein LBV76_01320 [Deltaproteobacteria bacterium]|jgi:hypothetical protein|nr:hypothetical protein [Deltaproteobacteria bacterium]
MAFSIQYTQVPFTRVNIEWNRQPPYATEAYHTMFDNVAAVTKHFADETLSNIMAESAARTHAGQSSAGLIASGLSASMLRVPEIRTGSLVAVSL